MNIEIIKCRAASVAHGRGSDSYRTPAGYDIVIDDRVVGKLWGAKQTYMAIADWSVMRVSDGAVIRCMLRSKKAAVDWINNNIEKF